MIKLFVLFLVLGAVAPWSAYRRSIHLKDDAGTCGYPSCTAPQPGKLNVHLVPHTHDDVGWLKTVDQYYYGSRTDIQNAGVQYILDSVVDELIHDPNKKFIYVETAFFWKWWLEQTDDLRHQVKQLVANGQLEFIGGGWSMNDEATTHYHSVIDQFTWGLRKLNDTFGTCGQPKVGWQIDPFGHSRETASIMAQLGFDGLFFARLDYQDKDARLKSKTMEMIWEGSSSLGTDGDILTGVLRNHYSTPGGFCWDVHCGDDPIVDNPNLPDFNVNKIVDNFINTAHTQSQYYKSNNIMMTFGDDFQYQYAHKNYKNIDKLIRYVNERQESGSDVNVFYSTPSCYVKSLNDANLTWPTKSDDFFPYASDPHSYWTGYFTSRPTLKFFERKGNNNLQVCKQLASLANLGPEDLLDIDLLKEVMGIMQHHDAIAGTEKQHVAEDYARQLTEGFKKCGIATSTALGKLFTKEGQDPPQALSLRSCPSLNSSQCYISESSDNVILTVYNPISRPKNHFVRLPVTGTTYLVRDASGAEIPNQVVPISEALLSLPGRNSNATSELVFKATDIPALGFRSYYISKSNEEKATSFISKRKQLISNGKSQISLDENTGFARIVTEKANIEPTVEWYEGALGDNGASERRSSGAYIFRPNGTTTTPISKRASNLIIEGSIVSEIHQTFSNWGSQVIRQYADEDYIEIDWLVGPIPIDDNKGKEIVIKYTSDLKSNGYFWTDSSGRETLQRKRDFRPTWDLDIQEPVAGNYYPITTDLSLSDPDAGTEMAVIIDRAQGGSSMKDGQLELMVHRRLLHDDAFGVGEALNETAYGVGLVARGQHWVIVGGVQDPEWLKQKQLLKQEKVLDSLIALSGAGDIDFDTWSKSYNLDFSGLTNPLPDTVQILTLEPWKGKTFLIRLEHMLEKKLSQDPVTVNLENLFTTFDIVDCRETTLGANKWLDESTRLQWRKETNEVPRDNLHPKKSTKASLEVTLNPRQIRTFVCEVEPKTNSRDN